MIFLMIFTRGCYSCWWPKNFPPTPHHPCVSLPACVSEWVSLCLTTGGVYIAIATLQVHQDLCEILCRSFHSIWTAIINCLFLHPLHLVSENRKWMSCFASVILKELAIAHVLVKAIVGENMMAWLYDLFCIVNKIKQTKI